MRLIFTRLANRVRRTIPDRKGDHRHSHPDHDGQRRDTAAAPARPVGPIVQAAPLAGVLTPMDFRYCLMFRAACRNRCSFSTIAMRTKPSPSSP